MPDMPRTIWPALLLVLFLPSGAGADAPENQLLGELTREGAQLSSSDQPTKLPPQSLDGSLDAAAQSKEVRRIAGKKYSYEQFVRNSPVAPFLLEIHSLGGGERKGGGKANQRGDAQGRVQQIDLWFVAHGALATVTDRDLMGQLAGDADKSGDDARSKELTEKELGERDLNIEAGADRRTNFFHFDLPVLERVRLSGLGQSETTRDPRTVVAALRLDPRFTDDADYPARWRPIKRDAAGNKVVGEPQPYSGFAGYCQATELAEPKGALFVECHVVFDEPQGWFNGTNLLRAKLPLLVQDNVRTFRRKLAAAERAER
jgi:hypothetical protein